ncbi:MAG: DUF2505 domain-containing protein [Alcanivoracaceae bacterium]|nr:DUF2505 domain-containing protein [Alcanivoracaceae bacterium]
MKVERYQDYPLAADKLLEVLTDRQFFEARHTMSGAADFHFDAFGEQHDGFLIRILRDIDIPMDKVPSFARRFIGNNKTLVQEFLWVERKRQPYRAHYRFALGKVPVEVHGAVTITERDGMAQQHMLVEVHSTVPLIGSKLAAMVGERVDKALDSDYRATLKYLRQQGLISDS